MLLHELITGALPLGGSCTTIEQYITALRDPALPAWAGGDDAGGACHRIPCALARGLLGRLLEPDASRRLGAADADAVRRDPFFGDSPLAPVLRSGEDWRDLDGKRLPPPFAPLAPALVDGAVAVGGAPVPAKLKAC